MKKIKKKKKKKVSNSLNILKVSRKWIMGEILVMCVGHMQLVVDAIV